MFVEDLLYRFQLVAESGLHQFKFLVVLRFLVFIFRGNVYIYLYFSPVCSDIFLFSLQQNFIFGYVMKLYGNIFFLPSRRRSTFEIVLKFNSICILQADLARLSITGTSNVTLVYSFSSSTVSTVVNQLS